MTRRNKPAIWVLIFMLITQVFTPLGIASAADEPDTSTETTENNEMTVTNEVYGSGTAPVELIDVKLYYTEDNGETEVEIGSEGSKNRMSLGDNVKLAYEWSLPNSTEYGDGDKYEFLLPAEFRLFNDIVNEPLMVGGTSVGSFTVTASDNKVVMTFNDFVRNFSNISGSLNVWSILRQDLQSETSEVEINFPLDGGAKIIPIKLKPTGGSVIGKSGSPDNSYNGKEIFWTVDINTGLDEIKNAILSDDIQDGQELDVTSIEVRHLVVALNGSKTEGALVDSSEYTNGSDATKLELGFDDIDSAFRVKFTTNVTAEWDGTKTFNNTATLTGDGVNQSAPAGVQIRTGEPLNKRSIDNEYDPKTQTLSWEIQYNYNGKSIAQANAKLLDTFSTSPEQWAMAVDLGSFVVSEVTLDANGNESGSTPVGSSAYTVTPSDTGFTFQFNSDIDKPYKIRYKTQVTDKVFDNQNVTNTVTIDGTTTTKSANRWVAQGILIKENRGVDYAAKTTRWRVTFNGNGFTMENAVLKDMFPNDGLELLPDTLTVNGQAIGGTAHVLAPIDGDYKNGFTIDFDGDVTTQYTIEYTTSFDPDVVRVHGFRNGATIEWEEGTESFSQTRAVNFNPNAFTNNNGFKNGWYNAQTKEITWDIGVNYNLNDITTVVEDYLLNGQLLVLGSIEVYEMQIAPNGTPSKIGAALDPETAGFSIATNLEKDGNPGFKITFNQASATPYFITYKTTLDNQLVDGNYPNTATFYNGEEKLIDLTASVSVSHGTEYVAKEGVQNNQNARKVDWTIWINRGQSHIPAEAKIIDTPSTNQLLLEDTFKVYGTSVAINGTVTKDSNNELVRDTDYTLEIIEDEDGNQSFELVFPNSFKVPYVLEYQSFLFNAKNGDDVSNSVEFEGEGITNVTTTSQKAFSIQLSGGSGTGSGEVGSLTITKEDADNPSLKLQGAEFSLYYQSNNKKIATLITDSEGKVMFENLLFTDYILVEDKAPEGYLLNVDNEQTVQLVAGDPTTENLELTIKNTNVDSPSLLGRLGNYVWVDDNKDGIQNEPDANGVNEVTVELYKENGLGKFEKVDETQTADKDGKPGYYLFDELVEGKYKVCFKRPNGYEFTTHLQGSDVAKDSDANPSADPFANDLTMGCSDEINLPAGGEDLTIDAGLILARLGNYVWIDSNRDGVQNEPETNGVNEVTVELYKENGSGEYEKVSETQTADKDGKPGYYLFDKLEGGNYKVCFKLPNGYSFTRHQQGSDREIDSNANPIAEPFANDLTMGCSEVIILPHGGEDLTIDAGLVINSGGGGGGGGGGGTPTPDPDPEKEPEDPTTPDEPEKPTEPEDPTDPTDPEEPAKPGTSEEPKNPDDPEEKQPVIKEKTPQDTPIEGRCVAPADSTKNIGKQPSNGTVTVDENCNWTYIPNPGFIGEDTFTIVITDEAGNVEEILIEIDVEALSLGGSVPSTENPSNNQEGMLPQTGESTPIAPWFGLLLCILVLLSWWIRKPTQKFI